jgi:hypothetical protein
MTQFSAGPILIIAGLLIVVIGIAVWSGALGWFGRLPGDIRVEREGVRIYIPLVSMLLISLALSLLMYLINRWR